MRVYGLYNPTLYIREFSSVEWIADLLLMQKKGARDLQADTHLLNGGFYIPYNSGKAVFYCYHSSTIILMVLLFYLLKNKSLC